MPRLLAAEAYNLGTVLDHMTHFPALSARILETRIVEDNRRFLAAVIADIDMRRKSSLVDFDMNEEQHRGVPVARPKMLARCVGSELLDDRAVSGKLVFDRLHWKLRRNSLDEHLAKLGNGCRGQTQRVAVDIDRLAEQLHHDLLRNKANLELGVTESADRQDHVSGLEGAT